MNTSDARSIQQAIQALGNDFNPAALEATKRIYAPFIQQQPRDESQVRQDVPYGGHERQVLDIYGKDLQGPAVLFIHGGGFVAGNKRGDDLYYANVGHAFAQAGIQAVLANYRLAPGATWPSGIEDIESAINWLNVNLGLGKGGRPLILIGQSAGASHVAGYLLGDATAGHASSHLSGCVLMSGLYRMSEVQSPGAKAYFGVDELVDATRSPIGQVKATSIPVLVTVSELDPAGIAWHSYEMAQLLTRANNKSPAFRFFAGHNHVSPLHSIGSPQDEVMQALGAFVLGQH
jgi:acetyl esterase/lipase